MRPLKFAQKSESQKRAEEAKKRREERERVRAERERRRREQEERERRYWEQARARHSYQTRATAMGAEDREMALEVINAGYRVLSRKHHPDAGGTHDKMVVVNRVCDQLRLLVASR